MIPRPTGEKIFFITYSKLYTNCKRNRYNSVMYKNNIRKLKTALQFSFER